MTDKKDDIWNIGRIKLKLSVNINCQYCTAVFSASFYWLNKNKTKKNLFTFDWVSMYPKNMTTQIPTEVVSIIWNTKAVFFFFLRTKHYDFDYIIRASVPVVVLEIVSLIKFENLIRKFS